MGTRDEEMTNSYNLYGSGEVNRGERGVEYDVKFRFKITNFSTIRLIKTLGGSEPSVSAKLLRD